jgi:uncharacterized RDD family membrane protein YckC
MGTRGKIILGLKLVDIDTGSTLRIGLAIERYVKYIMALLSLFVGILCVGIDKRKQGWHNKLAGTIVIRTRATEAVNFKLNDNIN